MRFLKSNDHFPAWVNIYHTEMSEIHFVAIPEKQIVSKLLK